MQSLTRQANSSCLFLCIRVPYIKAHQALTPISESLCNDWWWHTAVGWSPTKGPPDLHSRLEDHVTISLHWTSYSSKSFVLYFRTRQALQLLLWRITGWEGSALCFCFCETSLHSWRLLLGRCCAHNHPASWLSPHSMSCLASPQVNKTFLIVLITYKQRTGLTGHPDAVLWQAGSLEVCLVGRNLGWKGRDSRREWDTHYP